MGKQLRKQLLARVDTSFINRQTNWTQNQSKRKQNICSINIPEPDIKVAFDLAQGLRGTYSSLRQPSITE